MIAVEHLTIRIGTFSLADVSFSIETGQHVVLMGRSGCGKTTLLEAICGLRRIEAGKVLLAGRDVTRLPPGERGIGYVPQDLALFPTKTVRQHLEFALQLRRWTAAQIHQRVEELAALLGISSLLRRRPLGLSGGEAQRVALGRALSFHPALLLLDEPLNAVDDEILTEIVELLCAIQRRTGVTTLHVTHRMHEAGLLSNRILRLEDGVICESPQALA